ncbi:MAG: HD domain-containing protein [Deltaproteobacteria bacterium]|nr:HD domain-containing protein [Deltaproteobacteria bacterium]
MPPQKTPGLNTTHLYFPLAKLAKNKSIFSDPEKGIFKEKYKEIMTSIIGKQLALNTYYANDLIALANTRITIDLLKIFDALKINFKVNLNDITKEERNHALDLAMGQIIQAKREFLENINVKEIPEIQSHVKNFISKTIENHKFDFFKEHLNELKAYLEMANSVITSERNYIGTVAAIKRVIDNEQRIFNLPKDEIGETIEHVIKTTLLSLMLARQINGFDQKDYELLSIICLGHDGGKALIPENIIYKNGRLTQVENDIMKSHALLSFILASNNQFNLDFEPFVMALHHIKEDKNLPQSYGISKDTHTSFYEYLTPGAQAKLNEIYHLTKKYYRIISIADTFEAITAQRVYKRASSIGKALEIMISDNKKGRFFYQPYLDRFIRFIIKKHLPKNLAFKITDEILDYYYKSDNFSPEKRNKYKKEYIGVVIRSYSILEKKIDCIIYNKANKKIERRLKILPAYFLKHIYSH